MGSIFNDYELVEEAMTFDEVCELSAVIARMVSRQDLGKVNFAFARCANRMQLRALAGKGFDRGIDFKAAHAARIEIELKQRRVGCAQTGHDEFAACRGQQLHPLGCVWLG